MAYDSELAERVRSALADHNDVREMSMFGGLAFMVADFWMRATLDAGPIGIDSDADEAAVIDDS